MTTMNVVKYDATKQHSTVLQDKSGAVWVSVALPWWDISTRLWWWLTPSDKKAWVILNTSRGQRVRTRAVRIGDKLVSIRHTL